MEQEIWKDIKGYEGLYQVSNLGRVKSLPKLKKTPTTTYYTKEMIKKSNLCKGYLRLPLCKEGHTKSFFVHCLVAQAFLGDANGLTVNHKDENKLNNKADNLEYMTLAENIRYGGGIQRSAKSRTDNPLIGTPVNQYTLDGVFIKRYISINQAKRENNFHEENISLCCNHKRNQSNGFIWRYDGDTEVSYRKKTNAISVSVFDLEGKHIGDFESAVKASEFTKVSRPDICDCCKGRKECCKGYKFSYSNINNERSND